MPFGTGNMADVPEYVHHWLRAAKCSPGLDCACPVRRWPMAEKDGGSPERQPRFDVALPRILGALFTVVAGALAELPRVELETPPPARRLRDLDYGCGTEPRLEAR